MTTREEMLLDKYKALMKKQTISMNELDDLMYQVEKLLMNYRQTVESRDKFKAQIKDLKSQLREIKNG